MDEALQERGTLVLPDVLTNAGGVIVSYFEWTQNRQGFAWTLEEVRERLEAVLTRSFAAIWDVHQKEQIPVREAAYAIALRRIAEATELHGTREYFEGSDR